MVKKETLLLSLDLLLFLAIFACLRLFVFTQTSFPFGGKELAKYELTHPTAAVDPNTLTSFLTTENFFTHTNYHDDLFNFSFAYPNDFWVDSVTRENGRETILLRHHNGHSFQITTAKPPGAPGIATCLGQYPDAVVALSELSTWKKFTLNSGVCFQTEHDGTLVSLSTQNTPTTTLTDVLGKFIFHSNYEN